MKSSIKELVEELEAEINNGGFDQFFFNSAGDRTAEVIDALSVIGATRTATIVKAAASKFPGGMPPRDQNARQEALEVVSPDSDAFEDQDDAFLKYEEDLAALVAAHEV